MTNDPRFDLCGDVFNHLFNQARYLIEQGQKERALGVIYSMQSILTDMEVMDIEDPARTFCTELTLTIQKELI